MPRDARSLLVDRVKPVGETERTELDPVRAERVRLDDVGPRAHVLRVHFRHEIRLRHVQRVEALVDEDAFRVQHRPHRPIAHEHALFDRFFERFEHLDPSNCTLT